MIYLFEIAKRYNTRSRNSTNQVNLKRFYFIENDFSNTAFLKHHRSSAFMPVFENI